MTRIIAGAAGSVPLEVPSAGTRPTTDRVRESLFASLESEHALADARVLDLYAGSGALGLEALSRGAARADLVEKAPRAAAIAERNALTVTKAAQLPPRTVTVHRTTAIAFLRTARGPFDLVFLDPPYDLDNDDLAATLALLAPALAPDALVLVERASRTAQPSLPGGLTAGRTKRYGDTAVHWAYRR